MLITTGSVARMRRHMLNSVLCSDLYY